MCIPRNQSISWGRRSRRVASENILTDNAGEPPLPPLFTLRTPSFLELLVITKMISSKTSLHVHSPGNIQHSSNQGLFSLPVLRYVVLVVLIAEEAVQLIIVLHVGQSVVVRNHDLSFLLAPHTGAKVGKVSPKIAPQ